MHTNNSSRTSAHNNREINNKDRTLTVKFVVDVVSGVKIEIDIMTVGKKGHYTRMCYKCVPSVKTTENTTIKKNKVKSNEGTDRYRSRFIQHMKRKQPMFELPFLNIRNTVTVLKTNNSAKVELKTIKETFKVKNID